MADHVLTLNAGSSSIKFALFAAAAPWPRLLAQGQVQGLGAQPSFEAATVSGYPVKRPMAGDRSRSRSSADFGMAQGSFS